MKFFILLGLLATIVTTATAAENPSGINQKKWNELLVSIATKGETMSGSNGLEYRVYSRLNPKDLTVSHSAEYLSVVGFINADMKFQGLETSAVSENWVLNKEGNWEIDQWVFRAALDGTLVKIFHVFLLETANGGVLKYDLLPVGSVTDEAEAQRWVAKANEWLNAPAIVQAETKPAQPKYEKPGFN